MTEPIAFILHVGVATSASLLGGAIARRLGQPPLVGYLLAGIAIGPFTPGFVGDIGQISALAEVGVVLLVFALGVEFSLRELYAVRKVALGAALAQIGITVAVGSALAVVVLNDADAAGIAEMRFGAGAGQGGTVFVLTLGTGLGSALFIDGALVPNTELGHMEIRGRDAERRSAAVARIRRGLSWKAWAGDLDEHLHAIDRLFWPTLIILGGGVSKNADRFLPYLTVRPPVVPAQLRNDAGIVGAAMAVAEAAQP